MHRHFILMLVVLLLIGSAIPARASDPGDYDGDETDEKPCETTFGAEYGTARQADALSRERLQQMMEHERILYEMKLSFTTDHMNSRNKLRIVGVVMAVLLGFSGIGLILAGWRFQPEENIDAELKLKWGGAIKISGASSGIIALALSVLLIQQLINDPLVFR